MRQLDIFEFVLEQMEGHVALRVGSGRTTPNEDFRVPLCQEVLPLYGDETLTPLDMEELLTVLEKETP